MKPGIVCAAIVSVGMSCGAAMGSIEVWTLSGPITMSAETAGNPLTGGATDWSLEVTIDTAAPDLEPADPVLGRYATTSVLTLGTLTQAFASELLVFNDLSGAADMLQFVDVAPVPSGWQQFLVQVILQTTASLTVLTSDAIPLSPPNIGDFQTREFGSIAQITDQTQAYQMIGEVDLIVPEPASVVLAGLCGLGLLSRRRQDGTR